MLINFKEIEKQTELYKAASHETKVFRYINEHIAEEMGYQIGELQMGTDIHFATDKRWSLHDLIVYCLKQTGPADLYFCTYAIKEYQARLFTNMKQDGLIKKLTALVDYRISVHDPGADQLLKSVCDSIGYMRTHAKLVVIRNQSWGIAIAGSANLTSNTTSDIGVITCNEVIADYRINWITKNINNETYK